MIEAFLAGAINPRIVGLGKSYDERPHGAHDKGMVVGGLYVAGKGTGELAVLLIYR